MLISSKDFEFLHSRARFASILSCVLGLETTNHNPHHNNTENSKLGCVGYQHLITDKHSLKQNSKLLHNIVETLNHKYKDIIIEEKYTSDREILIGLTVDYRHLKDWQSFKENTESIIRERIQSSINANRPNLASKSQPFIQSYSSHPFLDVYGMECNKGLALDNVLSQLEETGGGTNVIYFGDSENDNPAFRKSDISIGIRSDTRLISSAA